MASSEGTLFEYSSDEDITRNLQMAFDRTQRLLEALCRAGPSTGTLQTAVGRCPAGLSETEAEIREAVSKAQVVYFDGTGFCGDGYCYRSGQQPTIHFLARCPLLFSG